MKACELIIRGIKCDATGCDYRDDSVTDVKAMLNVPCPKCGANLLTPEDYLAAAVFQAAIEIANAEIGERPDGPRVEYPVILDGTGKIDLSGWPDYFTDHSDMGPDDGSS